MLKLLDKALRSYSLKIAKVDKQDNEQCWVSGCKRDGMFIVYIHLRKLFVWSCDYHVGPLIDIDQLRYISECPACGCRFGQD